MILRDESPDHPEQPTVDGEPRTIEAPEWIRDFGDPMCGPPASPEATAPPAAEWLPSPEDRARRSPARGVPIQVGGDSWLLASRPFALELNGRRDRLFDEATAEGTVDLALAYELAATLLLENYNLTAYEAGAVLGAANAKAVVEAVMDATLGPPWKPASWSDWMFSALIANGIRPDEVPHELLPYVLNQLVQTGRAVPADRFVHSMEYIRKAKEFRDASMQ